MKGGAETDPIAVTQGSEWSECRFKFQNKFSRCRTLAHKGNTNWAYTPFEAG